MSDREYRALSLQIEAQAIMAEVEGMKAENAWNESRGNGIRYGEDGFICKARELRKLAAEVDELVTKI